jgi:hypothetical protein
MDYKAQRARSQEGHHFHNLHLPLPLAPTIRLFRSKTPNSKHIHHAVPHNHHYPRRARRYQRCCGHTVIHNVYLRGLQHSCGMLSRTPHQPSSWQVHLHLQW